jgi:hypothetical protein
VVAQAETVLPASAVMAGKVRGMRAGVHPQLAGLDVHYLAKKMDDYASGECCDEVVTRLSQQLSPADRHPVSLYETLQTFYVKPLQKARVQDFSSGFSPDPFGRSSPTPTPTMLPPSRRKRLGESAVRSRLRCVKHSVPPAQFTYSRFRDST